MADVFVSYKRQDEAAVGRLVKGLREEGLSVWWDRDIPPDAPWEDTIEKEHEASKALIVCWSKAAVASENVKAEARRAKAQNRIVQTFIEPCDPPMFFSERQGVDLSGWTGKRDDPRFRNVVEAVRAILEGRAAAAGVGLGVSPKRKLPVAAIVGVAVAVLGGAAVAVGLLRGGEPAAPTTPTAAQAADPRTAERRQLEPLAGVWGAENSCSTDNRYTYSVSWDPQASLHLLTVSGAQNYRSVGEVLSVRNGIINTRVRQPGDAGSQRGDTAEFAIQQGALQISTPNSDAPVRLIRC